MSETTLIVADLHINSTVALCRPVSVLDDGGSNRPSRGQRWLWQNWENLLEQVEKKKTGSLYTIVNGDACEGDAKDRSLQLMTRNPTTIVRWAAEILDPLAKLSAGLFVLRGTPAHGGKSGNLEEQLGHDLGAIKCPETKAFSWWSLLWKSEGVRMDIAHHPRGNGGGRPMNTQGMIDRLASDTLFEYANRREPPPDLVIRSHIHQYRDSRDAFAVRAITTPAWTLATEYIHRLAPNSLADIGAILIFTSAGHYEVEPVRYQPAKKNYFTVGDVKNGNSGTDHRG